MALQIAPLRSDGAQRLRVAFGVGHFKRFGERRLVIDEQRNQHVVFLQNVGHTRVGPHGSLHFPTIHASEAREIDERGLSFGFRGGHTLFVVGETSLNSFCI